MAPAFPFQTLKLNQQPVRDLAWLLGSPGLLDPQAGQFNGQVFDDGQSTAWLEQASAWLIELDRDPTPLLRHLEQRTSRRLGYYVENLLGFWLRHAPDIELLAEHLLVKRGAQTIGELDFIFRTANWGVVHFECAYKFYLLRSADKGIAGFFGPNSHDRLDLKLDKLFQRQLPLSGTPEARAVLPAQPERRLAWFKGWLFYPYAEPAPAPDCGLSASHPRGWWQTVTLTAQRIDQANAHWQPLLRHAWIAPAFSASEPARLSGTELQSRIAAQAMPMLVARLVETESGWHEIERGFVVPDDWPDRPL